MSATTEAPPPPTPDRARVPAGPAIVTVPAGTHRARGLLLLGLGVFQVWLWATRVVNLVQDPAPRTTGFIAVHALLYVAAFVAAFVLVGLGVRMRREAQDVLARTVTVDGQADVGGTPSHVTVRSGQPAGPPDSP